MFRLIRWLLAAVLGIGVPVFVYLAFIADEPLLDAENDVDLGRKTAESIAAAIPPSVIDILPWLARALHRSRPMQP